MLKLGSSGEIKGPLMAINIDLADSLFPLFMTVLDRSPQKGAGARR
jgi:hypothetical protein